MKLIVRLLIGAMFVATAVLKLLSLDEFELYIYSFGIFNYITVTVLARLLVALELLMGLFLLLKQFYKQVWLLIMLTLTGFTVFLFYVALFRNDANCHCFGEFIELNPLHSILKNVITMALMLLIMKETDYTFKFRKWLIVSCFALAVILPFVVFPMDALYNKVVSPSSTINLKAFEELQKDTALVNLDIEHGNHIVAFFLSGCKFCKLGIKKVNTIAEKHQLDGNHIKIFISGSDEGIEKFKQEFALPDYQFFKISPIDALKATDGSFPTFLYVQDGKVLKSINLRGISEEEFVDFLK